MNQNKQQRNEKNQEKELLKEYLNQYYTCRMKRVQLERRLRSIHEEMNMPIGGYKYSPVNYGGTNTVGTGAASFVYRISEIETRIEKQKNQTEKALLKVMDIMDFLEESSTERMILELRFIDCKNWENIEKEIHLSRRACFGYQNKALEKLLNFKKVQAVLKEYKTEVVKKL
ncbi:MAG: hypothetical protein HFH64_03975 [Lachnospiraceae bacterium]|nr:hypothetical protein [Lachnospiraceae bacterium]